MNSTSYSRYLEAKKTVDERAINIRVWEAFINKLNSVASGKQVNILDLGSGTGNSLFRLLDAIAPCSLNYTVVDIEASHLATLESKLYEWARQTGGKVDREASAYVITSPDGFELNLQVVVSDIEKFLSARVHHVNYDAVIAQAILDLLDLQKVLPDLKKSMEKGGLLYFPINFDGMTTFIPTYDLEMDRLVEEVYHDSMRRGDVNRSHTGRNLLVQLRELGMQIIEAGSSDWVVFPDPDGRYVGDEAYFLKHILFFVRSELMNSTRVDNGAAELWHASREKQVDNGELIYIAHQLDVLAANL